MSLLLVQLLSGLANAMFLFLIASGLTLIFGVTRIVNFAHGSFYMLAAYLNYAPAAAPAPGRAWRAGVRGGGPHRGRGRLRGSGGGRRRDGTGGRGGGGDPPATGVPGARALSAPAHLRAGPGRRGRDQVLLGGGQQDGAERAGT